ncbi:MAG TPA: sigma-70 family RNA polymerase sigma factor [Bacteroidia bacterium]|nr:sigma-70 family RNA polymerase sigma factor [Bacteroidia bacterium]HNT80596.1 sigma-70 family RNA polymerase sigma factor [Bacteroidia bacterium]
MTSETTNRNHDEQSDIELLNEYRKSGDHAVAGILFKKYMHLVFGVSMKYLKNSDDAKDMVQKVFEKLMMKLRDFEIHNFPSWLHSLTRNECLMYLRSSKRMDSSISFEEDLSLYSQFASENDVDHNMLEQQLQNLEWALKELDKDQRICISLFYIEKLSYKEISEKCNLTFKEVKSFIQNGKRNLKIILEKRND